MPPSDAQAVGKMPGKELSGVVINITLARGVDVRTRPDNVFMEKRMFGSDPEVVAAAGAAYIQGLHQSGVIGGVKHFPGHGAAGDRHKMLPVGDYERNHVDSGELVPLRPRSHSGAETELDGHLVYP